MTVAVLGANLWIVPWDRSTFSTTFAGSMGFLKLGRPVLLSNLSTDANSGSLDTTST